MNRRQLALVIIINTVVSIAVALAVVWVFEARRPDPEELAALSSIAGAPVPTRATGVSIDLPPTATSPAVSDSNQAPAPSATPTPDSAREPVIHVVQPGESVSAIAGRYGVSLAAIVQANNLENPDFVFAGQRLVIPVGGLPTPTPATQAAGITGLKIRSISGAGDLANEYAEIVNDTDLTFNLQGWKMQRRDGPEYIFNELLIFPGGSVRLYSTSGTDSTIVRYWGQSAAVWQSGAQASLLNAQGDVVATYQTP